ncbi:MAG TPA: ABC transporter permease subunit [Chthoniobacterales bacterium]|nr:ABC transporter permease subunit [Chthoniobacterales bacterium]
MKSTATQLGAADSKRSFNWVDLLIFAGVLGFLWSILEFGSGMMVHFDATSQSLPISTNIRHIPYYAGRTLIRMWIAFGFSLIFTFSVGYAAAKSKIARAIILPFMDIMQSIPVLSFLTIFITFFVSLFPGSLFGVECASVLTVFTGQVWNMAFGFYHSMVTIPQDLQEAATNYRLTALQRFQKLEVPASMHSLIWNCMMSFGAGWFAVSASEAITVLGKNIQLPGLGSYMATAVSTGNYWAAFWAIISMLFVILATDQLVWRPLLVWADKFKMELTESAHPPTSWFYDLLRRAYIFEWLGEHVLLPVSAFYDDLRAKLSVGRGEAEGAKPSKLARYAWLAVGILLLVGLLYEVIFGVMAGLDAVYRHISGTEILTIVGLGFVTLLRVVAVTVLATLIWTPIGVWIGSKQRVAQIAQPLVQIFASFPVNMTFPLVVGLFVRYNIDMNWGCILLIALGAQWYILFNVIAGAMAIPNDLKEAARNFGLKGWPLWKTLILPAIFPFWITGACTAAGGAWNATILAEVATWGDKTLKATGLGAFISEVSSQGGGNGVPALIVGTAIMALFVVIINKLVWRRLYSYAEHRFHLD